MTWGPSQECGVFFPSLIRNDFLVTSQRIVFPHLIPLLNTENYML